MASALEHYVNNVRTLTAAGKSRIEEFHLFLLFKFLLIVTSSFLGNFRELTDYLNDSTELLTKNSNILDNVLETLDVQQHSLGVMFILVAKISEIQVANNNSIQFQTF